MRNWWSGHKVLDPVELEARYSIEDGMAYMDAVIQDEMSDEGIARLEKVKETLDLIPPREADFVELYFFRHLKQTDIADIFGVSQPTVCYRLQRAADRIQFLLNLPDLGEGELLEAVETVLDDPLDVKIMMGMYETTCQSEVAKQLGVSQGLVRHRFIRSIEKMDKYGGMDKYVGAFRAIAANLNILREVQRVTWTFKVSHSMGAGMSS